jgi:hypothetical protein
MSKHQRHTPRELDAYNAFIMIEDKVEAERARLTDLSYCVPTATGQVIRDGIVAVNLGEDIVTPAQMPYCDAADVYKRLERFQSLVKAMNRKRAEAGSLI